MGTGLWIHRDWENPAGSWLYLSAFSLLSSMSSSPDGNFWGFTPVHFLFPLLPSLT